MSRVSRISIRPYAFGIVIALTLTACGGGGSSTSGQGNSVAVSTPVSAAALTYESVSFAPSGPTASISATPNSGQASLKVHFAAADVSHNGAAIIRYEWDFGDGNTASGADVSYSYDVPNRYTVRLTLTDSNGQTDSASRQIYVSDSVLDNSLAIVPNEVYFFDDFDYRVRRSGDAISLFQNHGWSSAKAENLTAGGNGYLYTTRRIPGYSGAFPGKDSTSVLAIEARPSGFDSQTDFYLQFGGDYDTQLPANVWFQYWIYTNYYNDPSDQNDQMSHFGPNQKFIYPSNDGFTGNNSRWMLYSSSNSEAPYAKDLGTMSPEYYMYLADSGAIRYLRSDGTDRGKIGQTNLNDHIVPNRWTLVKIHIDTSMANPKYEQWLKPLGGQWLKVAHYIQGQTANLSWHLSAEDIGGHRAFRLLGAQNNCPPDPGSSCNSWTYLDDFTVATAEDSLPIYPY